MTKQAFRVLQVGLVAGGLLVLAVAPDRTHAMPLGQNGPNEVALSMSNPASHPGLAVPDFIPGAAGDAELAAAGRTLADVLWNDIDFEEEFHMVSRQASASVPLSPPDALPYAQWTQFGADAVIVGTVLRAGSDVSVQVRAISVKGTDQGHQFFGMQYGNCKPANLRPCAHQIADDFHEQVRGLHGVARTKLAFVSDRDNGRVAGRPSDTPALSKEVYFSDYDGANQTRFTVNRNTNMSPIWSPVGGMLAYVSWMAGPPDIYLANLAEPGRKLSRPAAGTDRVQNWTPAWSPDGKRLAFASTRSGNLDIWVVNVDGTGLRNLTNSPGYDNAPTWSPDGGKIAFTSDRAGVNQLYVMSADGTGVQKIVSDEVDKPTWSSLGFIAFTDGGRTGHEIGIYDFSTGQLSKVTRGGSNESPAIAPNGRHIAFVTEQFGRPEIAVIDRAGGGLRQITSAGDNAYPNWGPMPTQ